MPGCKLLAFVSRLRQRLSDGNEVNAPGLIIYPVNVCYFINHDYYGLLSFITWQLSLFRFTAAGRVMNILKASLG